MLRSVRALWAAPRGVERMSPVEAMVGAAREFVR
jgi:hypothetical protein